MDIFYGAPIGVFGFVILIILIGSVFSYLKVRSNNETIRRLAETGQPIDPTLLSHLNRDGEASSGGGMLVGGVITLAVAVALYLFGQQIGAVSGDDEVGPIFRAIALFPALIGGALVVIGGLMVVTKKKDGEG